jgi:hypothetical protein
MAIDLETATSKELRAWRRTLDMDELPPGAAEELEELILDRAVSEKVAAEGAAGAAKQQAKSLDEQAYKRWPELKDKESDFYKRTNELIGDDKSPGALLHASNEVAFQMFGKTSTRVPPTGIVSSGRSDNAPASGGNSEDSDFLHRTSKLHSLLVGEGLLKGDKETLARIATRAKEDAYDGPTA